MTLSHLLKGLGFFFTPQPCTSRYKSQFPVFKFSILNWRFLVLVITNRRLKMLILEALHSESKQKTVIFLNPSQFTILLFWFTTLECVSLATQNTRKLIQLYRINPSWQEVSVVCGILVVCCELQLLSSANFHLLFLIKRQLKILDVLSLYSCL